MYRKYTHNSGVVQTAAAAAVNEDNNLLKIEHARVLTLLLEVNNIVSANIWCHT